jgi:hypothetical protein
LVPLVGGWVGGLCLAIIVIDVVESCFEKLFQADPNGAMIVLQVLSLAGLFVGESAAPAELRNRFFYSKKLGCGFGDAGGFDGVQGVVGFDDECFVFHFVGSFGLVLLLLSGNEDIRIGFGCKKKF